MLTLLFFLFILQITYSYKTYSTSYLCIDSTDKNPPTFPSCLPGYILDIENVIYESTNDNLCSGLTTCQIKNKNTLAFACNRKRTCQTDINNLRFHINSTCGTTIRLYVHYRCLPVIQEQKDFVCESSTARRAQLTDINLSCERNYNLYITKALIGISLKPPEDTSVPKNRFKCNKDTQSVCNTYIPNAYRDICESQPKDQCKIRYNQRPMLNDCPYGMQSNYSMVEYSCVPGEGIMEDLPRIDICSTEISERLLIDRGLLQSPVNSQLLECKKQLFVPRDARLRLFMLEKSPQINARFLNQRETFDLNEFIDRNNSYDDTVQFELKPNYVDNGRFLIYFQVDSSLSEYAPFALETDGNNRRGKRLRKRDWGIIIGCIIGFLLALLLIATILTIIRISKRRRERALRYLKSEDDHRAHLNAPLPPLPNTKNPPVEQPYLVSSSPVILPTSLKNQNRPQSGSSTTSSIIMQQVNDGTSDQESLIKPNQTRVPNSDIDNFYEEIKEQQQQTALALGLKGDINPYLEPKYFEQRKNFFQGNKSSQPIRDHNEVFYYECAQ